MGKGITEKRTARKRDKVYRRIRKLAKIKPGRGNKDK
jgi:hypothetical protein